MSQKINSAFQEALRQMGRPTTPDDLRHRGVVRLRSVKTSDISQLIERAVNRTLMERTIGPLAPEQMAEVLHAAESQFALQLQDLEDLADSRREVTAQRRESQAELAELRGTIEAHRRAEHEPAARAASESDGERRLSREILACLRPLLLAGPPEGAGRDAAEALRVLVRAHVAEALEEQRRQFEVELGNQERRVAKLVEGLERTEKVLARVAASKDLQEGLHSIYRTVQGLSPGERGFEQKHELLQRLFEANVALREERQFA